jgi:CheY-like chemotaxis protein
MVVLADMVARNHDVAAAIERLRNAPETRHIPVIAVVPSGEAALEKEARVAGARLVVNDNAILLHLRPLLEQALHEE